jgi:aryl-alcohol dehydrogenase-like predicted oxidoreductase
MAAALPHHRLGGSEIEVSRIALGSWRTFERMPRADAERLLAHALERGIDFLDDARYDDETGSAPIPTGYSEVLFGQLLRAVGAEPAALTISNKLWWQFWPRQDAIGELEASLERMGLDRLGLLYSSTLPAELPVAVAVEQIAAVLATGRVGAWAVVNWSAGDLAAATAEAERVAIPPPCAAQLPYSLARTDWVEDPAMDDALAAAGASLIPSAALAGGALSGKYADGASGRLRDELRDPRRSAALQLGAALRRPAAALGTTPATLAIAFTLLHPQTAATLIGATTPAQIDAAIDAVQLARRLTPGDVAELRSLADSRLSAGALFTGGRAWDGWTSSRHHRDGSTTVSCASPPSVRSGGRRPNRWFKIIYSRAFVVSVVIGAVVRCPYAVSWSVRGVGRQGGDDGGCGRGDGCPDGGLLDGGRGRGPGCRTRRRSWP